MERHQVIQLRVTPEEKEKYAAAAAKKFLSVSEWLRKLADREAWKDARVK